MTTKTTKHNNKHHKTTTTKGHHRYPLGCIKDLEALAKARESERLAYLVLCMRGSDSMDDATTARVCVVLCGMALEDYKAVVERS